jgi:cell division protein FtsB
MQRGIRNPEAQMVTADRLKIAELQRQVEAEKKENARLRQEFAELKKEADLLSLKLAVWRDARDEW